MKDTIKIFNTAEELAGFFASLLVLRIREKPGGQYFSWLLSGGSTPKTVFRLISSKFRDPADWNRVKVFWGDERCVDPEDDESNYKMARENLLDHVPVPLSNIFRIRGEDDPVAEASRYSELFTRHIDHGNNGYKADLIMLGLGEDGHTASIFPAGIQLFGSEKLFEVAEHPDKKQKRITATGTIINHAKTVVILACGENKASRVAQIIDRLNGWETLPAARVRPENGNLIWLLDQKAAIKLKV